MPDSAAVDPQSWSNVALARGVRESLSPATAKRQPSTEPSGGVTWSGPLVAKAHVLPCSWKKPQ